MLGIDKPWNGEQRREREWFKDDAADQAIKTLWQIADKLDKVEGNYLKVLLLTGKRKSALAEMQWQQIDDEWFWNAPQSNVKNKRLHGIPLPGLVQRILHPRQKHGFVFARNNGCLQPDQRLQKKIMQASGMADFFFHGVRHLAETKLAELKVPSHIRDKLFDHVPNRGSATTIMSIGARCWPRSNNGPTTSRDWCSHNKGWRCCDDALLANCSCGLGHCLAATENWLLSIRLDDVWRLLRSHVGEEPGCRPQGQAHIMSLSRVDILCRGSPPALVKAVGPRLHPTGRALAGAMFGFCPHGRQHGARGSHIVINCRDTINFGHRASLGLANLFPSGLPLPLSPAFGQYSRRSS